MFIRIQKPVFYSHNTVIFSQVEHPNTHLENLHLFLSLKYEMIIIAIKYFDLVILAQCALNQRSHKKHNLNGTRLLFKRYMRVSKCKNFNYIY